MALTLLKFVSGQRIWHRKPGPRRHLNPHPPYSRMISPQLCVRCKGRLWCGPKCFILEKFEAHRKVTRKLVGKFFQGSSPPSVFVGWHGYPKVTIAPVSPPEILDNAGFMDEPDRWFGLSTEKIVQMRETLIQSKKPIDIHQAANPDYKLMEIQEVAMSAEPLDIEVELEKAPEARLSFQESAAPIGMSAPLKKFKLTDNPKVLPKVEYLVSDSEAKSGTALLELYRAGVSVHSLTKLLSAGLLGVQKRRKFVPTRWSITAVDSNVSKQLVDEKVKFYPTIDEYQLFQSHYLDNHFYVLLLPEKWCFEQLETWEPGGAWAVNASEPIIMADWEGYRGRKDYADDVAGAYYSARLAVAEHLVKEKRQAGCIVFREIGEGYSLPLGTWQIRENVRNALKYPPMRFGDFALVQAFLEKKLKTSFKAYKAKSKLLDKLTNQRKLTAWLQ